MTRNRLAPIPQVPVSAGHANIDVGCLSIQGRKEMARTLAAIKQREEILARVRSGFARAKKIHGLLNAWIDAAEKGPKPRPAKGKRRQTNQPRFASAFGSSRPERRRS